MTESDQLSKLEQEVSAIDALEVILRIGNNQQPLIDIRNQRSIPAMDKVMLYLLEKDLVKDYTMRPDSIDYATYATLTQKGREIYEKIKNSAADLLNEKSVVVFPPDPELSKKLWRREYKLETEEDEEQD